MDKPRPFCTHLQNKICAKKRSLVQVRAKYGAYQERDSFPKVNSLYLVGVPSHLYHSKYSVVGLGVVEGGGGESRGVSSRCGGVGGGAQAGNSRVLARIVIGRSAREVILVMPGASVTPFRTDTIYILSNPTPGTSKILFGTTGAGPAVFGMLEIAVVALCGVDTRGDRS